MVRILLYVAHLAIGFRFALALRPDKGAGELVAPANELDGDPAALLDLREHAPGGHDLGEDDKSTPDTWEEDDEKEDHDEEEDDVQEDDDEDLPHDLGEDDESTPDTWEEDGEEGKNDEEENNEQEDDEEVLPPYILEGGLGPHADLVLALPLVIMNLTNLSGMISSGEAYEGSHTFGDVTADEELLFDMVAGFFDVLHDHLSPDHAQEYCPKRDISVIRKCVDIALCLLQNDVGDSNFSIASYSLYEEIVARLDAISWDLIVAGLEAEGGKSLPDSFGIPEFYACESTYQWLYNEIEERAGSEDASCANLEGAYTSSSVRGNIVLTQLNCTGQMSIDGASREYTVLGKQVTFQASGPDGNLTAIVSGDYGNYTVTISTGEVLSQLQFVNDPDKDDDEDDDVGLGLAQVMAERTKKVQTLAAALRTSAVLDLAVQGTHHILDSHRANSSMAATVRQLELAWEPFCTLVKCDHTNYHDLFGATHTHSLALIEAGASAQHMRSHVRSRLTLENRMQRFLGEYGEHGAGQVYRPEGNMQQQVQQYTSRGRDNVMQFLSSYSSSERRVVKLAGLVDRDGLKAYLLDQGLIEDPASREDASLIQKEAIGHGPRRRAHRRRNHRRRRFHRRRNRRRRRQRRRRRFWGSLASALGSVVDSVANVVEAVGEFVSNLFKCLGTVTSMVAVGYCKKFPEPTSVVGVGLSLTASSVTGLGHILGGQVPSQSVAVKTSAVVGAVPGSPVTGGVRAGLGMGLSISCAPGTTCKAGLAVGGVLSALVPTSSPECVAGSFLHGFRCMVAAGVSISAMCCNLNIITGKTDCR